MKMPWVLAAIAVLAAGPAAAQSSTSQTVAGTGVIFQPLVLSKNTDLEFGTVVRPAAGSGVVTIDPSTGQRTLTGQGSLIGSGSTASRATFTVAGEGGQTFSISAPAGMTVTRSGGSETIAVTLMPSATSGALAGSPGGAGSASFGVGGELPVSSGTILGAYAGAFTVTVAYN